MLPLVDKVRGGGGGGGGMCRRAKHLQQLYAYSQNTLNDTHTYKKKKRGGEQVNAPPRSTYDDGPTDSRYTYIAIRSEHK